MIDKLVQYLKLSIESETKLKRESSKHISQKTEIAADAKAEVSGSNIKTEQLYQEALIDVMGNITVNVADYQKLEIIKFLFEKCPGRPGVVAGVNTAPGTPYRQAKSSNNSHASEETTSVLSETERRMQNYLLKCIESVALLYTTINYSDTFKAGIITPLIQVSLEIHFSKVYIKFIKSVKLYGLF